MIEKSLTHVYNTFVINDNNIKAEDDPRFILQPCLKTKIYSRVCWHQS